MTVLSHTADKGSFLLNPDLVSFSFSLPTFTDQCFLVISNSVYPSQTSSPHLCHSVANGSHPISSSNTSPCWYFQDTVTMLDFWRSIVFSQSGIYLPHQASRFYLRNICSAYLFLFFNNHCIHYLSSKPLFIFSYPWFSLK